MISLHQRTTLRAILSLVGEAFDISPAALTGKTQESHIAQARAIAMYLSRQYTRASLAHIGRLYGRHHTTVLNGVRVTAERISASPEFADTIRKIEEAIGTGQHTFTLHFEPVRPQSRVARLESRLAQVERQIARTA